MKWGSIYISGEWPPMFDRTINIDILAAWACWLTGVALAFGDMLNITCEDSGIVGMVAIAFGHLVTVQRAHRRMEERERATLELGKEAVRHLR